MKAIRIIITVVLLCAFLIALTILIHNGIQRKEKKEYFDERYRYTVDTISSNLDSFEKMCEYDIEKYNTSNRTSTDVSRNGGPYEETKHILFSDLGCMHDGFDEGLVFPDGSGVMFKDHEGYLAMDLIYYKDGNDDESPMYDKIGDHFCIYHYYCQPHG